jgi:hypothetical protein
MTPMEVPPRIDHPGLIIAGDKSKHLSPFGGTDRPHHKRDLFARCLLGSTAIGKARFFRRWTLDPWPRDRSEGRRLCGSSCLSFRIRLAQPLKAGSDGLSTIERRFEETSSARVLHLPEMVRTKFSRPEAKSLRGPHAHEGSHCRWPFCTVFRRTDCRAGHGGCNSPGKVRRVQR